jgi:hypothetical protein
MAINRCRFGDNDVCNVDFPPEIGTVGIDERSGCDLSNLHNLTVSKGGGNSGGKVVVAGFRSQMGWEHAVHILTSAGLHHRPRRKDDQGVFVPLYHDKTQSTVKIYLQQFYTAQQINRIIESLGLNN